jgi:hypothetical protein
MFDFLENTYPWGKDVYDIEYAPNQEELNKAIERAKPNWMFIHGLAASECFKRLNKDAQR